MNEPISLSDFDYDSFKEFLASAGYISEPRTPLTNKIYAQLTVKKGLSSYPSITINQKGTELWVKFFGSKDGNIITLNTLFKKKGCWEPMTMSKNEGLLSKEVRGVHEVLITSLEQYLNGSPISELLED
ncbi:hypothetical protein GF352_01995 [archaeon]|nr:hypothetical protein [archaeon]